MRPRDGTLPFGRLTVHITSVKRFTYMRMALRIITNRYELSRE